MSSWRLLGWASLLIAALATPSSIGFARSSGGYSRPSMSSPPSSSYGGYRTPSTSGGYGRPSTSYARPSYPSATQSPGDRSFSEGQSGNSYNAYRTQQDNAQRQRQYAQPQYAQPRYAQPSYGAAQSRPGWFSDRGYAAPPQGSYGRNQNFGLWSGLFLGSMLSNLGRSGSADFFHNNQYDPGYQQWRAEADRQAQDNADLRAKLADLDQQLAARDAQPRTPGAIPADVPEDVAKATPGRTPGMPSHGGSPWVWVVVMVGAGGIGYLAWQRRPGTRVGGPPASQLQNAAALLKNKLSGQAYTPSKFRVGMTLAVDPTPFILAAGSIKLPQPEESSQISVSAVGRVASGNTQLTRLYLPDGKTLVQLHLDAAGDPDECRLFGVIDEITPADANEWGVWLDPNQGLIGCPEFQTKDGKLYSRVWAPGTGQAVPRMLTETVESLLGTRTVQSQAMLYGAPTGVAPPGPDSEWIMVAALHDGGRAWVEVRSGIDISPVTLQLA